MWEASDAAGQWRGIGGKERRSTPVRTRAQAYGAEGGKMHELKEGGFDWSTLGETCKNMRVAKRETKTGVSARGAEKRPGVQTGICKKGRIRFDPTG